MKIGGKNQSLLFNLILKETIKQKKEKRFKFKFQKTKKMHININHYA